METADRDRDGLCDDSEVERRLNPNSEDSDGDGFSDFVEVSAGSDGRMSDSPVLSDIDTLSATRDSALTVGVVLVVAGNGGNYEVGVEPLGTLDPQEPTVAELFQRVTARFAIPEAAIQSVRGATFVAVTGRTRLGFDVAFAYPRGQASCRRLLPYLATVKRDDGTFVGSRRRFLRIEGTSPGWCRPSRCF